MDNMNPTHRENGKLLEPEKRDADAAYIRARARRQRAKSEIDQRGSFDLQKYLVGNGEQRLRLIYTAFKNASTERHRAIYDGYMLAITADMDEHPEWFDHGCLCAECRSCE